MKVNYFIKNNKFILSYQGLLNPPPNPKGLFPGPKPPFLNELSNFGGLNIPDGFPPVGSIPWGPGGSNFIPPTPGLKMN